MSPELLAIIKKYTKDKEWVEQNRYSNSIFEYILSSKDDNERVKRLSGLLQAVQVLLIEDDYLLLGMMTGVSKAKGYDLMKSAAELKDFRVSKDKVN